MNELPQVRRHPDGSINFDFYRRRAAHQRLLAKKLLMRRCSAFIHQAMMGFMAHIRGGLQKPSGVRANKRPGIRGWSSHRA
jgi:hypothetical protein